MTAVPIAAPVVYASTAEVVVYDPAVDPALAGFELINLVGVDIASLTGPGDDSVLAHSLQRVLDDVDRPHDAVAGWNAAIG